MQANSVCRQKKQHKIIVRDRGIHSKTDSHDRHTEVERQTVSQRDRQTVG